MQQNQVDDPLDVDEIEIEKEKEGEGEGEVIEIFGDEIGQEAPSSKKAKIKWKEKTVGNTIGLINDDNTWWRCQCQWV